MGNPILLAAERVAMARTAKAALSVDVLSQTEVDMVQELEAVINGEAPNTGDGVGCNAQAVRVLVSVLTGLPVAGRIMEPGTMVLANPDWPDWTTTWGLSEGASLLSPENVQVVESIGDHSVWVRDFTGSRFKGPGDFPRASTGGPAGPWQFANDKQIASFFQGFSQYLANVGSAGTRLEMSNRLLTAVGLRDLDLSADPLAGIDLLGIHQESAPRSLATALNPEA